MALYLGCNSNEMKITENLFGNLEEDIYKGLCKVNNFSTLNQIVLILKNTNINTNISIFSF